MKILKEELLIDKIMAITTIGVLLVIAPQTGVEALKYIMQRGKNKK